MKRIGRENKEKINKMPKKHWQEGKKFSVVEGLTDSGRKMTSFKDEKGRPFLVFID